MRLTDVIDQPGDEDMLSCEDRSFAPADAHAMEQARGVPTAARTMTDRYVGHHTHDDGHEEGSSLLPRPRACG